MHLKTKTLFYSLLFLFGTTLFFSCETDPLDEEIVNEEVTNDNTSDDDENNNENSEEGTEVLFDDLTECTWGFIIDDVPDNLTAYLFEFEEDGTLSAVNVNDPEDTITGGSWELNVDDEGNLVLVISDFPVFENLNGSWVLTDEDAFEFINTNEVNTLSLEQNCDDDGNDDEGDDEGDDDDGNNDDEGDDEGDDDDGNNDDDDGNNDQVNIEELFDNLTECNWGLIIDNIPDNLTAYLFDFNEDGTLTATNSNDSDDVITGGFWELNEDEEGNLSIVISDFPVFENLNGTWTVNEYEDGYIEFINENDESTLNMEQDC